MGDGRIVREDLISSPIEEDLKVLSHSEFGRRVHADDQEIQSLLDLSSEQMVALHILLDRNTDSAEA
jgi:hypothetical protein